MRLNFLDRKIDNQIADGFPFVDVQKKVVKMKKRKAQTSFASGSL